MFSGVIPQPGNVIK